MKKWISILIMILMSLSNGQAEVVKTPQRVRKDGSIAVHRRARSDAGKAHAVQAKRDRESKHPQLIQRLESRLIDAVEQAASKGSKHAVAALKDSGTRMKGDDVIVIVECSATADPEAVAALIIAKKGTVIRTGETHVKAAVPVTALKDIASDIPGVSFVRTPVKKRLFNTVVSEGRGAAEVNPWHAAGYTGQGVKIAVIDGGFAGLAALKSQGEIPASVIEVDFSGEGMTSGSSGHGSACAEIIYDLAPGSQLYLLKAMDASDDEAAKNYCKTQGIQIISSSMGYEGINFGDGMAYSSFSPHPVTTVNDANASGILWINSAGNEQESQAMIAWRDSNLDGDLDWDNTVDFNMLYAGDSIIPVGTPIDVFLTWNKWPVTNQDFDLFLYYWNGSSWSMLTSSEEIQNGSQPPSEWLSYTVTTAGTVAEDYGIFISKYSATSSPTFILRTFPYGLFFYGYDNYDNPSPGSIVCPGDAAASFTVGAIDCANYASGPLEYYSSLGPNNGAYTGKPVVVKPDICGPAGVSTATYGYQDFFGTSAATPHIAGLAALVKSAYPTYTSAQLKTYIQTNGVDLGVAGKDNSYGCGPCVLPVPKHALIVTTPYGKANPPDGTNWYSKGSFVAAALTNSPVLVGTTTQHVCTGWSGAGSVPAIGTGTNTGLFALTNNSSIAWQWATNFLLDTVTNGNGMVNQADQWCGVGNTILISATPAVSNRFSGWTGQTNGCTISNNQITAVMTRPRQITANFMRQYSLAVSTLYGEGNPSTGTSIFDNGTSVTARMTNSLVSVGTTQYVCRGWIGTGNVPASGTTTNAGPFTITSDSAITWLWKTNFWSDVSFTGSGSLSTGDCWVARGSNLVVTATSSNHWHFRSWSGDTNGCTMVSNKITVVMDRPRAVAGTFEIDRHKLIVTTPYGQANLSAGTNWFDYGSSNNVTVTNSPVIDGGTQYVCRGWSRTGSVSGSGTTTNTGMFSLTNDCSVVWLWTTNYWLHVDRTGNGSVSTSDVWIAKGTNVQVIATPGSYCSFGGWQGQTNGCTTSSNRITAPVTQARSIMAVFIAEMATNAVPKWWLAQHSLTNFNIDALRDVDFDGLKTWQEYIAGTNPTNSESCFRITQADRNVIGWDAVSGRVYSVYGSTNLLFGFQCLESNIPWTSTSFTNPAAVPNGYYKIDVRLEE